MAKTKAQRKTEAQAILADVAKKIDDGIDSEVEVVDNGKMLCKNKDGGMLMCELTIAKRDKAPDPLCVTINEEYRWIKRGFPVMVPWYLILHLQNNVQTNYKQELDPTTGKKIVTRDDVPGESFSYKAINPAEGALV